jgi:hypothetical protein
MNRAFALALLLAVGAGTRTIAAQPTDRPRLDAARVAGETLVGAYAGIGGYFLGRYVADRVTHLAGVENEETHRKVGMVGGVVVAGFATAGAVYAIGSMGDTGGDFNMTLAGTGAGFVLSLGVARLLLGPDVRPPEGMGTGARWATANVLALLPAIGATIGFNSTRRSQ